MRDSVGQTFERWDGKGDPVGTGGDELLIATRLVNLADVVVVFHRAGGVDAAIAVARERSGSQFDPALVALFEAAAADLFAELESVTAWGEQTALRMLDDAGFADVVVHDAPGDPGNAVFVAHKPRP